MISAGTCLIGLDGRAHPAAQGLSPPSVRAALARRRRLRADAEVRKLT
jgi:hypothetical protein